MTHNLKMKSDQYMASYFNQEAKQQRLQENKQTRDRLVTFGVLAVTVFTVTLAALQVDVWVPALENAVHNWQVTGIGF